MRRFVDSNVFVYSATNHPQFGETSRDILRRIEEGEEAITSTLVLCEISWVLEAMGKQGQIKPILEKILSYKTIEIASFDADDLIVGANNMVQYGMDFNDGVNAAVMMRLGISEAYSNDHKHLGKMERLNLIFD